MKYGLLSGCALIIAPLTAVHAQTPVTPAKEDPRPPEKSADPTQPSTDEIVVTAQRRTERLQNVGIAVSAFSGSDLKAQGVSSSIEIARMTPGIVASGSSGGQGMQFSVRGVTQSDYNDAIEAPVAVYVDDVYISSQQAQGMALFDIARVEALKGPQGTLFGRNATGGLVHFIVNKPELGGASGYIDGTYGRFDQTTLEGALNLPVGETLALRVSGIWSRHDAVWKNVSPQGMLPGAPTTFGAAGPSEPQDLGGEDTLAGRAQLLWEPSPDVQIRLTGSALRQNMSSSPWTTSSVVPVLDAQSRVVGGIFASPTETRSAIGPDGQNYFNPAVLAFQGFQFSPNGDGRRAPGASWFGYVPVDIGNRLLSEDFARKNLNTFRAYNAALHIDADLGFAQLAAVTAWSQYRKQFFVDTESSPVNELAFATKSNVKTLSEEIRLSSQAEGFSWTAGLYYLRIRADDAQGLLGPSGSALAVAFGMPDTGLDNMSVFALDTDSVSAFGQVNWEFAPKWSFVIGGRAIYEHQKYDYAANAYQNSDNFVIDTSTVLFPIYPHFADKRGKTLWAGKAQLEYRPSSRLLVYGGINRGVKAGSYNAKLADGTPPLAPADIPYRPEVLTSLEGGFKLTGPGNRYTLNATAYHYWYKDYQSFTFTDISGYVQNRDARTTGVEVEATARLGNLKASITGAYVDAKVKDLEIAPGVARDTRPTFTPKYSAAGALNYAVPGRILDGQVSLGASVSYQSSFYSNARNFESQRFEERTIVDFSANWSNDAGLSLTAFLKNAFDERYKIVGLDLATACGCNAEAYGMPQTWGVTVGYKF